ncbi:TVP38/TMEM64 family protein [uncultured Corynebacterium sp.]|uniref:TVP38/TMEM64 family protein n=1 Tax=uncultured Corynebacterium sp. TaxID=159447 RepID=UPI0025E539DA|nr:TVP38/TMEM64 family protein [uncultured Corynebacterium sp.]
MTTLLSWARSFGHFLFLLAQSAWESILHWTVRRWVTVIAAIVTVIALFYFFDVPNVSQLRESSTRLGAWFPPLFALGYVIFTQFPFPRTVWTVAAGILFGPWKGLALSLCALTVSAALSLLIVRKLLGDWIRPHLTHPAVFKINAHLERRGWLAIASLRMVAGVPFSLLNYVAALTPVKPSHFVLATLIGSIPTTALGVFFGDVLTGNTSPGIVAAMVIFAAIGVGGLYVDSRLPTRP